MNEFLKMDIFFFISTLAVILFSVLGLLVLWQFSRILKNIEHISEQVSKESDEVRSDLAQMRGDIKRGKGRVKSLFGFLGKIGGRVSKKR